MSSIILYLHGYTLQRLFPHFLMTFQQDNFIESTFFQGNFGLTEAKVLVNYYMPPMPRMAPMNYITDAKLKGEKYREP